jgi:hypothetical protein
MDIESIRMWLQIFEKDILSFKLRFKTKVERKHLVVKWKIGTDMIYAYNTTVHSNKHPTKHHLSYIQYCID